MFCQIHNRPLLQSKGLTVLHIRITAAVVCIQLLPHWTVAVNLQGNEKSNLPLNSFKHTHTHTKKQPTENNVLCLYKYIYGGCEEGQKQPVPFTIFLDRLINPEFQSYGLLYFTSTLKPEWQYGSAPPSRPGRLLSVANRLYQWKQHQFVQDDTFSE